MRVSPHARASLAGLLLLGLAPSSPACYPVPVFDRWANARLAVALQQKATLIEHHRDLNDALTLLRHITGRTDLLRSVNNPLDHTFTTPDEIPSPHPALLSPGTHTPTPPPLSALSGLNPAYASQVAPLAHALSRAAPALPTALTTHDAFAAALLPALALGRPDAAPLADLASGGLSAVLGHFTATLTDAFQSGAFETLLTNWRDRPPPAGAPAFPRNPAELLALFGLELDLVLPDDHARSLDALITLLFNLLGSRLGPEQIAALVPGLAEGLSGPLTHRLAQLDQRLPLGTASRTLYRCARQPAGCAPGARAHISARVAPGRGYAHPLRGEAQQLAQTETATVTWALDRPEAITDAFAPTLVSIHTSAAGQCPPSPDMPPPEAIAAPAAATHGRPTLSDTLYTTPDDPRHQHIPTDQKKVLGSRSEYALQQTIELYALAKVALEPIPQHQRTLALLGQRLSRCETLACELRMLLDAKTLQAEQRLRAAELRLAHLRYAIARETNTHHAQRTGRRL